MEYINIVKSELNGAQVNSVLLRDLHKSLGVKTEFSTWFKNQKEILDTYSEGQDYIRTTTDRTGVTLIVKKGLNLKGKQSEYVITLDMANHLCMLSRTKKGKEIRQYFINIEKQSKGSGNSKLIAEFEDHKHKIHSLLEYTDKMGEVVTEINKRVSNLEQNRRMESWMEKNLQDAKNRKVYELANGNDKLASKLHRNVWREFKKRFNLPRYNELTAGRYEDGLMYLNNLTIDMVV